MGPGERIASRPLAAHLLGGRLHIEGEMNSETLIVALMAGGVPEGQIQWLTRQT